jgi:hypothetical protein
MPRKQATSPDEIRRLLAVVDRDLRQADVVGLELDGTYSFLYNAALQLASMALRLNGLRVGASAHHKETFRAARDLVPAELASAVACFDRARRKRNALTYDQAGLIAQSDVSDLRAAIASFQAWVCQRVDAYLRPS